MASQPGLFNFQALTNFGDLAAGYRLYTYAPSTTTQKNAFTDQAGTIPHTYTADGLGGQYIALNARGELPAPLWLASGGYDIALKTPQGVTVWTRRAVGADESVEVFTSDLAGTETGKGDALIGVRRSMPGAAPTTQHAVNEGRHVDAVIDFAVPNTGATSATAAIQAMFTAAALQGVKEIYFPPGTYLLTNPNNDADYTCAVVISGLRNCVIRGAKGTKFVVNTTGAGAPEFGMFRIEQCEGLDISLFEMDGAGITINGTGANRSRGFVLVNYDVNNKATNLAVTNKRITFHHIYVHDIGGFVGVPPRTSSLAATPYTDGLHVYDCTGANLIGQDHFVGVAYVRNLHVANNRCVNDIVTKTPIDNMLVDVTRGCENALIENNYAYGFTFGAKCETATGEGPSGTEIRPSKNVTFLNNTFEEIGDPTVFVIPGPSGGDTYGLKINGINCKAIGNVVRARTVGVTGGGLSIGVVAIGTHADDSHNVFEGNYVKGAQYGVNHNDSTPTTRKSTYEIRRNRIDDALIYGILAQSNVTVEDNRIYRAVQSAIAVQSPNDTIIRNNRAYNCASSDNAIIPERVVFYQEGAGAYSGVQEWVDNVIIDDRGGGAAEYGYFIRGGTTYTNVLLFRPGYTTGLLTGITYDRYASTLGESTQLAGTNNPAPRLIRAADSPAVQSPWNTQAWRAGDRALREVPATGQPKAWVCTVSGTPGTWVSEGNL
jgi:hypothetical protein